MLVAVQLTAGVSNSCTKIAFVTVCISSTSTKVVVTVCVSGSCTKVAFVTVCVSGACIKAVNDMINANKQNIASDTLKKHTH